MADKPEENGEAGTTGNYDVTEHLMSTEEVAEKYATNVNPAALEKSGGLSSKEVCPSRSAVR